MSQKTPPRACAARPASPILRSGMKNKKSKTSPIRSTNHAVLAGRKNMAHTPRAEKRKAQKARKDMDQW